MSVYRPKGSKIYWMDFHVHGQRVRESTEKSSITLAQKVHDKRRQALRDSKTGYQKPETPKPFKVAATEWLKRKERDWSPSMREIAVGALKHLEPAFGKRLLVDIGATDIDQYQEQRQAPRLVPGKEEPVPGASGRTVNIEVSILRGVLKRAGLWERLSEDVKMRPERQDVGHALTDDEESRILEECSKSRSRALRPFTVLAIETGARSGTLFRLRWQDIDFENRSLKIGRDKTKYSAGREIPLAARAYQTLKFWSESFPGREPSHYVFPSERIGAVGSEEQFGFTAAAVYQTDPTRPLTSLKVAWEFARKRAGLPTLRIHDLRHSTASRLIARRVPLPMVAKIMGWSAGTLAAMTHRYGHWSLGEMRSAMEPDARPPEQLGQGSPQNPPKSDDSEQGRLQ